MHTHTAAACLAIVVTPVALAQTFPSNFSATNLATLQRFPTAMAVAPNGDVYFCQQEGALRVWQPTGVSTVNTFTVNSSGERGLIGVALDPAFATNRVMYVHYTAISPAIHNRVSRITVNAVGTTMTPGSEVVLLELNNLSGATNHNGGAIHFGPDGKLYIAAGDNANGANSQSIGNLLGKILRINSDGTLPADNPATLAGIGGPTTGLNRAIWAVGLRNPFTFAFHPISGRLFINDVGQGTWEEINDGASGRNFGWPDTEGRFNAASFPAFTNPLVAYHHSDGSQNLPVGIGSFTGAAITGGAFYAPLPGVRPNFPISFENDYFFGDVGSGIVRTFDPASNTGAAFGTNVIAIVDLAVAPDNTLLILRGAGGTNGALTRVTFTGVSGACCGPDGTCTLSNGLNCAAGSAFIWGTIACTPNPCTAGTGACCRGATCAVSTAGACTGGFSLFVSGAPCNAPDNATTPCCKADFNHTGGISVQDIFDFLEAQFSADPLSDINGSGSVSVQDIFDFLEAYFDGCV